ncbi:MAG: FtsX-like permease family protein [Candidatus Eisenbacteria bacterium]|nr:FtsX-like permease family protein [Candidatus Latescibacterota bacterium]MBD3301045.1 FtsX-like permease family protein [Candidatus Eisenbacteria bacterium]
MNRRTLIAVLAFCCIAGVGAEAAPADSPPPVLVGRRVAARLGLATGDTVRISAESDAPDPEPFRVAGIYREAADPATVSRRYDTIRMQLPDLDRIAGLGGAVDRISVRLVDPSRAEETASLINEMAYGFEAHTAEELSEKASGTFVVIRRFHLAISIITIFGGGVFVAAIMLLKVEEMRRELGMLRLIGIGRGTILRALLVEALLLTLLGSAVAIGLGFGISVAVNAYYRAFYDTTLTFSRVTPGIIAVSVGISTLLGLLAGGLAALRLTRRSPLELLGR